MVLVDDKITNYGRLDKHFWTGTENPTQTLLFISILSFSFFINETMKCVLFKQDSAANKELPRG